MPAQPSRYYTYIHGTTLCMHAWLHIHIIRPHASVLWTLARQRALNERQCTLAIGGKTKNGTPVPLVVKNRHIPESSGKAPHEA